jgi:hypothetical protein
VPLRRLLLSCLLFLLLPGVLAALPVAISRAGLFAPPRAASAAVSHGAGFFAIVDGFRSWYGSYQLAGLGTAWCIDHGIPAPDAALAYVPTPLDDRAPETKRAVAWAVGEYGPSADEGDRVSAAAVMLTLHDLMGATYPSGPLSLDTLTPDRMAGFEGEEAAVLDRARAIKSDAVAHAAFVPPLSVDVATTVRPGTLTARVHDQAGAGVPGVLVHPTVTGATLLTDVDATTDADGHVEWTFEPDPGPTTFSLSAELPNLDPDAYRPTRAPAQRIVRPSRQTVTASTSFVTHGFTILKAGDAEPRLPVSGATFRIDGQALTETVTIGIDNRTPTLAVPPGAYTVTEVEPPPGYATAGPWSVEVGDLDVTLEVTDPARRGRLRIDKVDGVTGAPVEGAKFVVIDESGTKVDDADLDALIPGHYEVDEVEPPPNYRRAVDPTTADVVADQETVVRIADQPLASLRFEKHPPLPGATFTVRPAADPPAPIAATCVTGDDGTCSLPPASLDGGRGYCWEEAVAPSGWSPAPGQCLDLGPAGSVITIVVDEPAAPTPAPPTVAPASQPDTPRPPPPPPSPPAPPATPPEPEPRSEPPASGTPPATDLRILPLTGASSATRLASAGLGLIGAGLLLLSRRPAGANSSGRRGRRRPRPPPRAAKAGRCPP